MTRRPRQTIKLDEYSTPGRIEQMIGSIREGAGRHLLTLDLTSFRDLGFGAIQQLGASLVLRSGDHLRLSIPPCKRSDKFWNDLMSSGLLQLTHPYSVLRSTVDRKAPFAFTVDDLTLESQQSQSFVCLPSVPTMTELLDQPDDISVGMIRSWMATLDLSISSNLDAVEGELMSLVFEAIWNIIEHAHKPPNTISVITGVMCIRRYRTSDLRLTAYGSDTDPLSLYWKQFIETALQDGMDEVLQITVTDNGNGIARSFGGVSDLESISVVDEIGIVSSALIGGATSKLLEPGIGQTRKVGYGLNNLSRSLNAVAGGATIRTGRVGCIADDLATEAFDVLDHEFCNLPGTSLCIALPMRTVERGVVVIGSRKG